MNPIPAPDRIVEQRFHPMGRTQTYDLGRCCTTPSSVCARKYENAKVAFAEFGSDTLMRISPETLATFENDKTTKILRTENGAPHISLPELIQITINSLSDKLYEDIEMDGIRLRRTVLVGEKKFAPALFIEGEDGKLRRIGKVKIEADCYYECTEYPIRLMRYGNPGAPQSIAEVATTDIDVGQNKYRVELIAPGAGSHIPAGATVSLRTTPLGNQTTEE